MPCACSLKLLDEEVIVLNYRSNYVVTSTNIMLVSLTESIKVNIPQQKQFVAKVLSVALG